MCTAITLKTDGCYFGRTLDHDRSYGEEVVITPRKFPFNFRHAGGTKAHLAIIGTACVKDGYPLYYDAMNEKGLYMAGLNFVGNAHYGGVVSGKINLAQFEFIPFVLSSCPSVEAVLKLLNSVNLVDEQFCSGMPAAQLHWLIADNRRCITVESVREGLKIYDNPVGVLTNNPPFEAQLFNLNNYIGLTAGAPLGGFAEGISLQEYSLGMGAIGLPGDLSSQSRFVRAAFARNNSVCGRGEENSVNQFFHVLSCVEQPRGSCMVGDGYEISVYSSCCSATSGVYYYRTYENHSICAVDMRACNLAGGELIRFPHVKRERIIRIN